ncbi:hypothetical protein C1H46_006775 [Malus baccata]|uniref:Uncharacterized protein n=1 Tax=Malus baccata TaxID=106549 RepID=A0A540N9B2_MALBA|nr:hypothetical protein C1H46_006775 [Malus baccata]
MIAEMRVLMSLQLQGRTFSEAWEIKEKWKIEKPLMNWRFPALENEIDMKDNLKWWAHTIAFAVR